ncbi:hypothetical protein CLF_103425 [Clonorchis sinensis]|uniref:C2H2-type domain-containing protein n=1 Tax=Clonorchis sinensis TaxID=79923 RepID=G7Y9Q0_CLOSI|nr:hypothetical protein CLF_103425 [Clonorchis sinensis]
MYTQEQGLAMDSLVSLVSANILMEEFEQKALAGFPRVRALCTEEADQTPTQIKNRTRGSGYPVSFTGCHLRRALVPIEKPNRESIGIAVIPYNSGTSDDIQRILNADNISVAFQKGKTLRCALVQLKDHLAANRTRDCVYKIKCNDCIKVYIGQTARELHIRIREHGRWSSKNADEYQTYQLTEYVPDRGRVINESVPQSTLYSAELRINVAATDGAENLTVRSDIQTHLQKKLAMPPDSPFIQFVLRHTLLPSLFHHTTVNKDKSQTEAVSGGLTRITAHRQVEDYPNENGMSTNYTAASNYMHAGNTALFNDPTHRPKFTVATTRNKNNANYFGLPAQAIARTVNHIVPLWHGSVSGRFRYREIRHRGMWIILYIIVWSPVTVGVRPRPAF